MITRRIVAAAVLIVAISPVAEAYYHFLRYQNRAGQVVALPQKFDLAALPNKTVSYFITAELPQTVGSSRVDLQACKLEYSIVSPK